MCGNISYKLRKAPKLISISPNSLEDVFDNAITIATAMGQKDIGIEYVAKLKERIYKIMDIQREARILSKSAMMLEWINPLFNCGHWIPHQIRYAGGIDLLAHPSGDSIVIPWKKIVKYNPEILIIAPCGYEISRTLEDMKFLEERPEWNSLRAVKNGQVYLADFDMFTQSSADTLVKGIECLAKMIHPEHFEISKKLSKKFTNYNQLIALK